MRKMILLVALLAPSLAAAAPPAAGNGPWIDWSELSRRAAAAQPPASPSRTEADARALGDRVGRMVAAGDCRGGERMAMEAGDSALVRAVRNHCRI